MNPALRVLPWLLCASLSLNGQSYNAFCFHKGGLVAGGEEISRAPYLALHDGGWKPMMLPNDLPKNGSISALADGQDGLLAAWNVTGKDQCGVARWDGISWTSLPKVPKGWRMIKQISSTRSSELYVLAQDQAGPLLGRYDGTAWSALMLPMGTKLGIVAPLITKEGDLVAALGGAQGGIYRLRQGAWEPMGPIIAEAFFKGLVQMTDGRLVRAREKDLEQWDGSTWTAVPGWLSHDWAIGGLLASPDGSLYVRQIGATTRDQTLACLRDGAMRYLEGRFGAVTGPYGYSNLIADGDGALHYGSNHMLYRSVPPDAFLPEVMMEASAEAEAAPAPYPEKDAKAAEVLDMIRSFVPEANAEMEQLGNLLSTYKETGSTASASAIQDHVQRVAFPLMREQDRRIAALGVDDRQNRLLDAWRKRQQTWSDLVQNASDLASIRLQGGSESLIALRVKQQTAANEAMEKENKKLNDMLPAYKSRNGL